MTWFWLCFNLSVISLTKFFWGRELRYWIRHFQRCLDARISLAKRFADFDADISGVVTVERWKRVFERYVDWSEQASQQGSEDGLAVVVTKFMKEVYALKENGGDFMGRFNEGLQGKKPEESCVGGAK
jgi:hypothetical protein